MRTSTLTLLRVCGLTKVRVEANRRIGRRAHRIEKDLQYEPRADLTPFPFSFFELTNNGETEKRIVTSPDAVSGAESDALKRTRYLFAAVNIIGPRISNNENICGVRHVGEQN